MFFPPGRPVYENLATSYVLVDALVEDLCEGGFSGVVEVVLRSSDYHVIVNRGKVVAAVEQYAEGRSEKTTVREVAGRSRRERGRISVVAYPLETAAIVASRVEAESLYSQLTTEFADPVRMIDKLRREQDREWFIELRLVNGTNGLIYLNADRCLVITSGHEGVGADAELTLNEILDECSRIGGSFDVYFKAPETERVAAQFELEVEEEMPRTEATRLAAAAATGPVAGAGDLPGLPLSDSQAAPRQPAVIAAPERRATIESSAKESSAKPLPDLSDAAVAPPEPGLEYNSAETLAEVKRLMGEVLRTIESATGAGDLRDSFALSLRAGQLRVADRYPFLDPFGSEFEYYAGEIAFVGTAAPASFVEGLSEALRLTVESMIETSPQPARLRARIEYALWQLIEAQRDEMALYGIDKAIEMISGFKASDETAGVGADSAE